MRYIIFAAIYLCAILFGSHAAVAQVARPSSSACYGIGNADARSYCLARAHRQVSYCYNVQDASMRAMCIAEVR